MEYDIEIPTDLHGCPPIITKTRHALLHPPKLTEPYSAPKPVTGVLDVHVSKIALSRALRLLEAIIRASEKNGWTILGEEERKGARIGIGDDPVTFSMVEQSERIELPSTKEEKAQWYFRPKYKYEDTGRLTLQITDWLPKGSRRTWSDGKKQRLDDLLGEFLDGVVVASASNKERRLERERWEREWRDRERQREEDARRIKNEKNRRAGLFAQCAGREKAAAIRTMILDVQQRASRSPDEWPPEDTSRWVEWATGLANRADPFTNGYFKRALKWTELDANLECEPEDLERMV